MKRFLTFFRDTNPKTILAYYQDRDEPRTYTVSPFDLFPISPDIVDIVDVDTGKVIYSRAGATKAAD